MAERVPFYSGKIKAELVAHQIDLPTAHEFLRGEPKEKCLMLDLAHKKQ